MDEERLDETPLKGNFSQVEAEDTKHLGDHGYGQTQVNRQQNSQEVEHGLMEATLTLNQRKDAAIPKYSCQVHSQERQSNLDMPMFQPRESPEGRKNRDITR